MYSKINHFCCLAALFSLFCLSPLQTQTLDKTTLERDFDQMLEWFTGDFDNFTQVWKEKEDSIEMDLRHEHIHSIFKPVSMPKLGEKVFFVKQYMDADTSNIYRQRIYHFYLNQEEGAVQLDIYRWKTTAEEERYAGANHHPEMLVDLEASDFRNLPGCAVYWKRQGDHFVGYMKEKACFFDSPRSGKRVYITDSLKLTQDQIWIRDVAYDEDGNYVFGNKAGIHHKLKRCRNFKGWIAVQKADSEDYYVMRNITIHDQGQRLRLIDQSGTATNYFVELSEVVHRSGIDVLKLAVYKEGKKKSLCYVWTNVEAERIGINMRSITTGFTLSPQ